MPDKEMLELCAKIGTEKDPKKLVALVTEPTTLLVEEQDAIKANINANLSKGIGRASRRHYRGSCWRSAKAARWGNLGSKSLPRKTGVYLLPFWAAIRVECGTL
jgi:hypothetical protein